MGTPLPVEASVESLAFSSDNRVLAVVGKTDYPVQLWDVTDLTRPSRLGRPPIAADVDPGLDTGFRSSSRFAPDSQAVAVGGPGGLALWTAQSPGSPTVLGSTALRPLSDVVGMAWSPDGRVIAVAGRYDGPDNAAVLLDVSDRRSPTVIGRPLYGLAPGGDQQLTFSADGSTLATSGSPSRAFDVRDPGNPRPIARLPDTDYVLWISRTDEGRLLAVLTGAEAGNSEPSALLGVRLFDITGAPRQLGPPLGGLSDQVGDVALTASGRRLVTSQPGEVVVWDVTDPARPVRLGRPLEPAGGHIDVALDADGRTLATVGVDGSVLLWSLDQPERPRQLGRPFSGVDDGYWSVGFSPDGRMLAAEGRNGVSRWDLRPLVDLRAHAVEQACRLGNGGLDPEEWVQYLPDRDYVDTCWS